MTAVTGWLDKLEQWFKDEFKALWEALWQMVSDAIVALVSAVFKMVETIIAAIPVPDFISHISICGLLSQAGPTATWVMGVFQLNGCFALLVSALGFRMLRKLLTLFQW